ncbi:MAG: hypothetical protein M9931_01005 [Chitinophagales bacterium]|nr:hypothetical protein [Chitinophagales bacterium]
MFTIEKMMYAITVNFRKIFWLNGGFVSEKRKMEVPIMSKIYCSKT